MTTATRPLPKELTYAKGHCLYGFVDPDVTEAIDAAGIRVDYALAACIDLFSKELGGRERVHQVLRQCRTQADWDQVPVLLLRSIQNSRTQRKSRR